MIFANQLSGQIFYSIVLDVDGTVAKIVLFKINFSLNLFKQWNVEAVKNKFLDANQVMEIILRYLAIFVNHIFILTIYSIVQLVDGTVVTIVFHKINK